MKRKPVLRGTSGDAILLTIIKLVTTVLGFVVTRLLSQFLSVYDYGTYSQILLLVSTMATLTILGMVDGINYFNCSVQDPKRREAYLSTIYALQCIVNAVAGCLILLLSAPLCVHFENPDIGRLLIFAAVLPLLQNLLSMSHVLLVSIGKARMLALRNLIVSLVRLAVVIVVVAFVRNVAVILVTTVLLDVTQIGLFIWILGKNGCRITPGSVDLRLFRRIFSYCAPMAVYTIITAMNRDLDKYLVALWTDTETLAVYANASKALPFDIIMNSFCTVLVPEITRRVAAEDREGAASLYKVFLEIAYASTGMLCFAALSAAPQLMELLYSQKYLGGLQIFCIYILVDLLRFTNITLIMSAAGKTRVLMFLGIGSMAANAVLNVVFYYWLGLPGPAMATLAVTLVMGIILLKLGAKELQTRFSVLFDLKYLLLFLTSNLVTAAALHQLQMWLAGEGVHYFVILAVVCGIYCVVTLLFHGKRLMYNLKQVNRATKKGE